MEALDRQRLRLVPARGDRLYTPSLVEVEEGSVDELAALVGDDVVRAPVYAEDVREDCVGDVLCLRILRAQGDGNHPAGEHVEDGKDVAHPGSMGGGSVYDVHGYLLPRTLCLH